MDKLAQAKDLFFEFSGYGLDKTYKIGDNVVFAVGELVGIAYEADRGEGPQKFYHEFSARGRPLLCISHDGEQAFIIGGDYVFTEKGFEG